MFKDIMMNPVEMAKEAGEMSRESWLTALKTWNESADQLSGLYASNLELAGKAADETIKLQREMADAGMKAVADFRRSQIEFLETLGARAEG